jgi:hypothetical protein
MRETKEALEWIVKILRKNKIPFEVTGGFASRIYGSKRILADIDIEVPDKSIPEIQKLTERYIIYGPREYKDDNFDLLLMTLNYKGQKIDICGKDSERIYDKSKNKWINEKTNISKARMKKVKDLIVPVVPLKDLISYKKELGRNVDKEDVKVLAVKLTKFPYKIAGVFFFVFGILFLLNSKLNFTGAFIGSNNIPSSFNLILGIAFILVSFILFAFTGKLEDSLTAVEEMELKRGTPVIIDTNYLIEVCKNQDEYKNLMSFVKDRYNLGKPVIVPKSVFNEFKFLSGDEGEKTRIKTLKETLSKCATTLEDIRGEVWENSDVKRRSMRKAEELLHQTPKYFAYQFLSEINKGEHPTIEKFIGKSRGKMSNAFTEGKYEENIHNAVREYSRISAKSGANAKMNFMNNYNVSPADVDVLSGAIYLKEVPDILGGKPLNDIEVITKDSHLIDSLKMFNSANPSEGQIRVKERV